MKGVGKEIDRSYKELIENAEYFRQMMESYRAAEKETAKAEEQDAGAFALSETDRDSDRNA